MKKYTKIIYWIATALVCVLMLFSATMYLTQYEMVEGFFKTLGYPTYIIYPLAIAKILGVVMIFSRKQRALVEFAYAGFFYDFVLAAAAHADAGDGGHLMPLLAIVLLIVSYILGNKLRPMTA
jgi:peptidoglycan/LPS O-acetylase OafA/YrhL